MADPNLADPFAAKRAAMREEFFAKLFLLGGWLGGTDTYKRTMWAAVPDVAVARAGYALTMRKGLSEPGADNQLIMAGHEAMLAQWFHRPLQRADIELAGRWSAEQAHTRAWPDRLWGEVLAAQGGEEIFLPLEVWGFPGGRELLRIAHGAPVSQVAFRPKANQLVTASDDGHVRVFDVARAVLVADFKCPGKMVSASFSPGGDLLAALSSEGVVSLFDPVHRKLLRTLIGGEAAFNLAFSTSGKRLATSSGDFAFVWEANTGRQLLRATHAASSETLTPMQWIYNAAITSDGKLLAYAARGDNLAHVWNVETGRQILELKHDSAVAAVSFNADGTKLGTGSYDGTARVYRGYDVRLAR